MARFLVELRIAWGLLRDRVCAAQLPMLSSGCRSGRMQLGMEKFHQNLQLSSLLAQLLTGG